MAGAADFVFVALFLCVAARLGLCVRRSALGMLAGLGIGLAAAQLLGGLPGLPFIAAGFVAANWREVRPGPGEIKTTLAFVAALAAALAIIKLLA